MAKSKLIKLNKKIEEKVLNGYNTIESSVCQGYSKIENYFVDQFLTKDGESVEEAKLRLNKRKY